MASGSGEIRPKIKHPDRVEAEAIVGQMMAETPGSVLKIVKELLCRDLVEKLAKRKEKIRQQRDRIIDLEVRVEELEEAVHEAWEDNDSLRRDLGVGPEY